MQLSKNHEFMELWQVAVITARHIVHSAAYLQRPPINVVIFAGIGIFVRMTFQFRACNADIEK